MQDDVFYKHRVRCLPLREAGICFLWIAFICLCTAFSDLSISFRVAVRSSRSYMVHLYVFIWPTNRTRRPWLDIVLASLQAITANEFLAVYFLRFHITSLRSSLPLRERSEEETHLNLFLFGRRHECLYVFRFPIRFKFIYAPRPLGLGILW